MQTRRYPPGHVFHETRLRPDGGPLPEGLRRMECSCGQFEVSGYDGSGDIDRGIDEHLLHVGVAARRQAIEAHGFEVEADDTMVIIRVRGSDEKSRRIEPRPGWGSRVWDAMRELRPELKGIGPGDDDWC